MRRLPLFVLPVVLFPGTVMPLHVFEARYRRMIAHCLEGDRLFGVLFNDFEHRPEFAITEGEVGCMAEIERFHPLPEGRSLLLARGIERFRVVDGVETGEPYAEALVAPYDDAPEEPAELPARRERVQALLAGALQRAHGAAAPTPVLSTDSDISFALAAAILIDVRWRQLLLELPSERARLRQIEDVLRGLLED
jgi:Lon protease-like protein